MRIFLALILAAGIVAVSGCGGSDCGSSCYEYTEYTPEPRTILAPAIATPPPAPSCNPCAGI